MADALLLYRRLLGAQLRSQLQYRTSFALDILGAFLISFLDFLAVLVIFHNVTELADWNVHEVAFLYALSSISFALTDVVIGYLDVFPQKIRDGTFDVLLAAAAKHALPGGHLGAEPAARWASSCRASSCSSTRSATSMSTGHRAAWRFSS